MEQKGLKEIIILAGALVAGLALFFFKLNQIINPRNQIRTTTPTSLQPTPTNNPFQEWNTYTSTGKYKYQVDIKGANPEKGNDFIRFRQGLNFIQIVCPSYSEGSTTKLPNPEWEPRYGWVTKYYKVLTINKMNAVQYVWSGDPNDGILFTALLRNDNQVVCEIFTIIHFDDNNFQKIINNQTDYIRVVNSFKFIQ